MDRQRERAEIQGTKRSTISDPTATVWSANPGGGEPLQLSESSVELPPVDENAMTPGTKTASPFPKLPPHTYPTGHDIGDTQDHNPFREGERHAQGAARIPLRAASQGTATYAYQRALSHRLMSYLLLPGEVFDEQRHIPVFLYDTLMLPGSLAALTGQASTLEVLEALTPAVIPGFRVAVHPEDQTGRLVRSDDPDSYAQGLLYFGSGAASRRKIENHYGPNTQQSHEDVQFEVLHRSSSSPLLHTQRRTVLAQVYVWNNLEVLEGSSDPARNEQWSIEAFLSDEDLPTVEPEIVGQGSAWERR